MGQAGARSTLGYAGHIESIGVRLMTQSIYQRDGASSSSNPAAGFVVLLAALLGSGCASMDQIVDVPRVSLTDVELTHAGFDSQVFMLTFDVDNPNPFPLPITRIRYQIDLGDQKFASGEAHSDFSIPAGGNSGFDLQVEIDILKQASSLVSVVRNGMRHHIEYQLQGSMSVDIPLVQPIAFSSSGSIQIDGKRF